MVMSQILKFPDFTKTQKSRYLENEALFFLQIKRFMNYISRATLWCIVAEVNFKDFKDYEVGDRTFQNLGGVVLDLNRD